MKFKTIFKDVFIYGIGDIFLKAFSIITLPIYTRLFTPDDFGILTVIVTISGLLYQLTELGLNSAYCRLYFEMETVQKQKILTSTVIFFAAVWGIIFFMLMLPFLSLFSTIFLTSNKYNNLLILSLLNNSVSLINGLSSQVLRNQFKAKLFTAINVISALIGLGLNLYFIFSLKLGLLGFILGGLIGNFLLLPYRLWIIKDDLCFQWSFSNLKELLRYGIPLVPMSLSYWVFASSDRLILSKLSTFYEVGLYSLANSISSVLGFLNGALGQAFSPHMIKIYENEPEIAPEFFGQSLTYILASFGVLCVGMTAFARETLMILSTSDFYPAAIAVGPLALGFIAFASTQITAAGISLSKKTYYFTIFSWLSALLNLILNILFIPKWGMLAASWSTALSYIFLTLSYAYISRRFYAIKYQYSSIVILCLLTFAFTVALPLIPHIQIVIDLILKLLYCIVYIFSILCLKGINDNDQKLIYGYCFNSMKLFFNKNQK